MKDALLDLIQHTHGLGAINLIKIVGTNKETQLRAVGDTARHLHAVHLSY